MHSFTLLETLLTELEADTSVAVDREYIVSRIQDVFTQLKKDKDASITWSVEDFEERAREIELEAKELPEEVQEQYLAAKKMPEELRMFSRKKFKAALHKMIQKHDASLGITWDTIDSYLHSDCARS